MTFDHYQGLIQSVFELHDGSGVVVTVGKYVTPNHLDINGNGIDPDYSKLPGIFTDFYDARNFYLEISLAHVVSFLQHGMKRLNVYPSAKSNNGEIHVYHLAKGPLTIFFFFFFVSFINIEFFFSFFSVTYSL